MAAAEAAELAVRSVLFADLVGSTALAERLDPEDFRTVAGGAVSEVVAAVDAAGGEVVEIAGDGVLAVFDSAGDAVTAARSATMRVARHAGSVRAAGHDVDVAVRVGVATGEVRSLVVDLGRRRVQRLSGPTVARATALEAAATPGTASIDDATLAACVDDGVTDPAAWDTASPATAGDDREERRTIFAVFVGLAAADGTPDPDAVLAAAAEQVAALVDRYGGTVKDAAGTAVVAMFGAPVAHEDDGRRALHLAIDTVELLARTGVAARVGVASGAVVVGRVGAGRHTEYGASGDAMNTAARLHTAAAAGEVLVAEDVHHLVGTGFDWTAPRSIVVKGKADPVPVRRVVGVAEPSSAASAPDELVGRAAEIALVTEQIASAIAGRTATVLVTGDAGVGTTTLVRAVERATAGSTVWIALHGEPWAQTERFRAVAQVPGLDVLAALAAGPVDDAAPRVAAALIAHLESAASSGAVVLAVDDLHHADPASVEVLARVAEAAVPGVVLLATTRDDGPGDEWTARLRDRAEVVRLAPLSDDEARALLDRRIGDAVLPFALERRVLDTAAGSPAFLEHLVGALADQGRLVHTATGWHHEPGPVEIPDSVQRARLARADALPAALRTVLVAAAVLRSGMDEELVAHVATVLDPDVSPVGGALVELERRRLVERSPQGTWTVDATVEAAVAATLVRRERRRLHRRAAEALEELGLFSSEAPALARHWSESDEPERAVDPALLAAEYALRRLSYDEAAALQRLAVQAAPASRTAELALGLGRLEAAAGRYDEAMQAFADAADAGSTLDGPLLGAAAAGYEDALFASRRVRGFDGDRSVELLRAAADVIGTVPTAISARVHAALARALAYRRDPTALDRSEAAVELARGCGDPAVRGYALMAWRAAREGPEWLAARRDRAAEMIEASVEAGDDALTNEVQRLALVDDLAAGDVARADMAIAELSSRIERLRRADQAWYPPMWRGLRALWSGDLDGADDAAEAFRHEGRRVGYPAVDQVYGLQLYLVRRRQGRADEVAPLFARLTERVGERWWAMAASLAVETGDLASARRILDDLCIERSLPVGLAFAPAVALLVDALEAIGHVGLTATLRPMLAPWSGQFAIVGAGAVSLGPADLALGRLARIAGDDRAARAHFAAARRLALAASSPFDADDAAQALAALN